MFVDIDYNKFQREMNDSLRQIFCESYDGSKDNTIDFEAEQKHKDEIYAKIKRILDCPDMEKCHPYLYSLDRENVNECDEKKIINLYECGVQRGLIHEEDCNEDQVIDNDEPKDDELCGGPDDSLLGQPLNGCKNNCAVYTVLYSAKKDGVSKMGPFYSKTCSEEEATKECVDVLTANGYTDVQIMAVDHSVVDVQDDVEQEFSDANSFEMYEDDSAEYEKQETGDNSVEDAEAELKKEENPEEEVADVADSIEKDEVEVTDDKKDEESKDSEEEEKEEPKEDEKESEEKKDDEDNESKGEDEEKKEEEKNPEDDKSDDEEDKEDEKKDDEKSEKEDAVEEKKLSVDEKSILKDEYTKLFKDVLGKTGLEKSIDDMTLEERTSFYEKLSEEWTKNDPSEFMTDKEQAELNKKVVKTK